VPPGRRLMSHVRTASLVLIVCALTAATVPGLPAQRDQTEESITARRPAPLTRADVEAFADSAFLPYLRGSAQPSLALAVVHGDSILFMKGYGTEDQDERRPVSVDQTLFNVASLSKLVTATAAMQLVEQGKLTLDGDIASVLSDFRIVGKGPPVSLRHLLTHTSGLEEPFLREVVAHPAALISLGDYFAAHPPRRGRTPGGEIRYSNYGMALAGHMVERASGESFYDYVKRHILTPLAMTNSSFRQPPPPALAGRVATAGSGPVPNALLTYPAGSLVSSASDMARFMIAHLNGGRLGTGRVLADSTARLMHTTQWRADPRIPGVGLGFFESDIGGEPGLFHTGARTHFSLLYLFPDRRVGIFIVHSMRQGGPFQTLRTDFVREFVERYFPHAPPTKHIGTEAAARAATFTGVYRPVLLPSTTIMRAAALVTDTRVRSRPDGSIDVSIPGGGRLHLMEIDTGLYRVPDGPQEGLSVAFVRDAHGSVRRMAMSGSTQDPLSFDRLSWYQRGLLHAALLSAVLLLFIGGAVTELFSGVLRLIWRRKRALGPPDARRAWGAAVAASTLMTLAPVSIAVMVLTHQGDDSAADALRQALTVGLTFLLAGTVVGLTLIPLSIHAWRARYWTAARRTYFTMLAAGVLVAAPLLLWYHLLGYWF